MASSKTETRNNGVTHEQFRVIQKVTEDPFYFSSFANVIHPVRGRVSFSLYPYQKSVLWYFLTNRFNIVLKFRQAGLTELIALYCLWLAMYHDNKNIIIISIKDRVAKKVLRRIRFLYRNLPWYLQTPVINGRPGELGTQTEMEFSNGSTITSIPTTEDAGRSEAVSLLVIDEAAIVRWAAQIWAAAFPTLSTGGSAILNSCVTGDTEIVGRNGNFRIDSVCPDKFGKKDISHLGLEVLSHTGKWQRVLGSVNKGQLETWEIETKDGKRLKCTPAHKLLTPDGWRTVREIIEHDFNIVTYDSGIDNLKPYPITKPPKEEVIKPIPGYPGYHISNLGKVFIWKYDKLVEKEARPNGRKNSTGHDYYSICLWRKNKKKKFGLHNLVAKVFLGEIPEGYVVDHIDGNPEHNYITNLEIVTISENTKRASLYSRSMKLGGKIGKGFPNLQLIGKIREKALTKHPDQVIEECKQELGITITRSFISRVINNRRTNTVQISKLTLIRKYIDTIYDISVEEDQSYICNSLYINHNTPYGVGNFFHKTWVDAVARGNEFIPIRLKWQMHPERDLEWYRIMSSSLGPRRTAQEIDGDFLTSGNSVFDLVDIKAIEDLITEMPPYDVRHNGNMVIIKPPQKGHHYYIAADIASGRSRDYSAFTVMDRAGVEHAYFKGKMPVAQFANLLMSTGKDYNRAVLAPESNDIGLAVTTKIQESGYPNLFYTTRFLKEKGESKPKVEKVPGWYTTLKTRPIIIDELEDDIRNERVEILNKFFVQEAYTFIYDDRNRPVAMGKHSRGSEEDDLLDDETTYTDDSIMSEAICNYIRKGKVTTAVVAPT